MIPESRAYNSLNWLRSEMAEMATLIESWASINSGSSNQEGLSEMCRALKSAFSVLDTEIEEIQFKNGTGLHLRKRPSAPIQVFLGGHMDTVYSSDHPFQEVSRPCSNILRGPGVADMKGGLVILLHVLQAFEKSCFTENLGWEVFINPDEEIGSVESTPYLIECAKRNHIGLIFEPSYPDGTIVSSRKGSANFELHCTGRPAHAGRDFHKGAHAIFSLSEIVAEMGKWNHPDCETTINVGSIEGGVALNIVPDRASCHFNIRVSSQDELDKIEKKLAQLIENGEKKKGIFFKLKKLSSRPPKPLDSVAERLLHHLKLCANELGVALRWKPSGGVCDGNTLAAAGLPTLDSLGVIGGEIHTENEYILIDSLIERASLTLLFLIHLAKGDVIG